MKFPVFASFLPLVLISIIISAATVIIFAQMHHHAINEAMERSIKDSLAFVKEKVSAPMGKLQKEALLIRKQIIVKDLQCHQPARKAFNGSWIYPTHYDDEYLKPATYDMLIHLNMADGLYSYVYQSIRKAKPYPTAPVGTTNPDDFPWGDCLCGKTGYCDWAVDNDFTPVMNYKWPDEINFTITGNGPYDSTGFPYSDGARALTNTEKDKDGQWVAHEVWKDVHDGTLTAIISYAVPVAFDANGHCVNTLGIDMDMTWTTTFLNNLNITASDVSIVFPDSLEVLATSYKALAPGFKKKNESDPDTGYELWRATASPEPRLTEAIKALQSHLGDVSFEKMPNGATLTNPKDSDYIFSAQPIRESKLNLMVLIVTEKGYYFDEGDRARNEAIIISVVLLCVMVVCTILNAVFLTAPLKVLGVRMIKTAALQDDDDDCESSILSEISDMQEAYYTMKTELGRLKSYLPQSVLHGNDDDVDDEGSIPEHSTLSGKPTTIKSTSRDDKNTNASSAKTTDSARLIGGAITSLNTESSISSKSVVVMSINLINFHGVVKTRGAAFCDIQRQYLEIVNRCVRESKGYVDFFQGDHVLATFNAVNNIAVPTKRAAMAAHNITKVLREHEALNCSVAIGFTNGNAHVGNMGTKEMQRFNVIGTVYARALMIQQLATRQLKESVEAKKKEMEENANQVGSVPRKNSGVSIATSRILTTREATLEFDCDLYWQSCDLVTNLPGKSEASKPSVLVSVEHMKNTKCDEWMYQLEESESADPFSAVNSAFGFLLDGRKEEAIKAAEQVHPGLLGAAKLQEYIAKLDA